MLTNALAHRSIDEIFDFEEIWGDLMDNAYDAALWDAAYIIGCGCGDDGFWDFRAWLIAQGQEIYEKALAVPESLIDMIDVEHNAQEGALIYVVMTAYQQKKGEEIPLRERNLNLPRPQLRGRHWGDENVNLRFPKLTAKFGDCENRWAKWLSR